MECGNAIENRNALYPVSFQLVYNLQCHVNDKLQWTLISFLAYVTQAATKKQKYEKISEKKMSTPVEVLCKVCVLRYKGKFSEMALATFTSC